MKDKFKIQKKYIVIVLAVIMIAAYLFIGANCSSCERYNKSCASEYGDGLYRVVTVYDYQGDKIATYEGKIDVEENDSKVLFDLDGKRYIYYNCLVEVIEK